MHEPHKITQLLLDWRAGNNDALHRMLPVIYDSLRAAAKRCLAHEKPGHTLQATALVNEAYLRLIDTDITWKNRAHFVAVMARAMRRILVDYAKSKNRQKRGGSQTCITLLELHGITSGPGPDVLDLEDALSRLERLDPRKAQAIELNFFGGLTYDEVAEALDISAATVDRELRLAKAWLVKELRHGDSP